MRRLPFFFLAALGGLLVSGCGKRESPVEAGIREQVLHRGLSSDPTDVDPHVITALPEINIAFALFEGLVAEDPVDLHPVPGVAERWELSGDSLTYTFHLRDNARWSNGEPVTAADFVASCRRVLTKSLAADYAPMLYVIDGAEAYHKSESGDFSAVGITAVDARTLRIRLAHPVAHFLSLLVHPVWFPVHLPTLEKSGSPYQRGSRWTRPENLVGNGAFVLRELQPGRTIRVEKSPTYWDAASVRLNAIVFHPATSVDTEERAFRNGQLHITESLPFARVDSYRREQPDILHISPFLDTYFYRLNTTRPPLDNPKIRRALSLAVDRKTIVERILRGGQEPARSFTPPDCGGYTPPDFLRSDIDAARALLAEAGHPGGAGLEPFEILINSSGNHLVIAEAVQEMWRRELGLNVSIVNMEQGSLFAARRTLSYQILRSDWAADYNDPNTFLKVFTSDSSNNHTGWKSAAYDALINKADRTAGAADRFELLREAESLLLEEAPIVPIFYYTTVRLIHPAVKGWHPTVLDHHPYKHVWLEE